MTPALAEAARRRLAEFANAWPAPLGEEFLRYRRTLRPASAGPVSAWGEAPPGPYWMDLPAWAVRLKEPKSGVRYRRLVRDATWGQVCLFYAVRIQDDILDGQLPRTSLSLAPSLFFCEADEVFASVMGKESPFWRFYRKAIRTTVRGILRVSELQRDPLAPAEELLESYGSVDAVFTVGPSAVCRKLGASAILPALCTFVREIGKVAQSLDDLEDLDEDLADGRFNYPAKVLLARLRGCTHASARHKAGSDLTARREAGREIAATLDRCLDRAERTAARLGIRPAMDLVGRYRGAIRQLASDREQLVLRHAWARESLYGAMGGRVVIPKTESRADRRPRHSVA
jgi:hypothetical protein